MQPTPPQPYTILRIKRKRNEEPLDALVVDSRPRRKKSRGTMNVFQFAETVEHGAWEDEEQKQELQNRLSNLARSSSQQANLAAATPPSPAVTAPAAANPLLPSTSHSYGDELNRKYTVVPVGPDAPPEPGSRLRTPTAPPKVWARKDLDAAKAQAAFRMFDAVPSSSTLASLPSNISAGSGIVPEEDAEMAKFLPMLQDYLKMNDTPYATPSPSIIPHSGSAASSSLEEDYVWDVFYQRPTTFQELFEPSQSYNNIATLTGLPAELSGLYDSDSDSDYDDEDDEDSNAEDWYKNDYPEEEDSDGSDMFHEDSGDEVVLGDNDDHEWR